MNTAILLWGLWLGPYGSHSMPLLAATFATREGCVHVQKQLEGTVRRDTKCIQADYAQPYQEAAPFTHQRPR